MTASKEKTSANNLKHLFFIHKINSLYLLPFQKRVLIDTGFKHLKNLILVVSVVQQYVIICTNVPISAKVFQMLSRRSKRSFTFKIRYVRVYPNEHIVNNR
jgi:hypothetical protein